MEVLETRVGPEPPATVSKPRLSGEIKFNAAPDLVSPGYDEGKMDGGHDLPGQLETHFHQRTPLI